MDALLVLVGLVVIAIPVAVIYLLVSHAALRRRLATLEADVARQMVNAPAGPAPGDAPAPAPQVAATPPPKPREVPPPAAAVVAARKFAGQVTGPARPSVFVRVAAWLAPNWFYLVSALSLALAGLFLVQYGVENGLFPPAARVLAALGFGGALIAGGAYIDRRFGDGAEAATAYLPSVFSGAGLVSIFGGVVAAHLLYDLVGPAVAFAGMAATGALGVALGWRYGPLLAGVGVVGAFAAPLLVATTVPATSWLYLYFAIVTALGLGIDTIRRWGWVSVLALAGGFAMGWLTMHGGDGAGDLTLGFQAHVMALVALAILVPARSFRPDHEGVTVAQWLARPTGPRPGFATCLAAGSVAAAALGLGWTTMLPQDTFWMAILSLVFLTAALTLWSVSAPALQDLTLLPVAALLTGIAAQAGGNGDVYAAFASTYVDAPEPDFPIAVSLLCAIGLGLSVVFALRAVREGFGTAWALAAALMAPVTAVVIEVTWSPAEVIGAYPWALHAMALAAVMTSLALRFARLDGANRLRPSLFVLSALAAVSFALVVILSLAALTVALTATVVVAAALDRRFDLPLMQVFVSVGTVAVGARLVADPGLAWALEAPIWEVLLAYGGALAGFLAALWLLRGLARAPAQLMLDTAAWSTGGVLLSLVLYRVLDAALAGDARFAHWSMGLYAVIWLSLMVAQLRRREGSGLWLGRVRALLALLFGLLGAGAVALSLTLVSPFLVTWDDTRVAGPPVLNTLFVAYALPALVLAFGAWRLRAPVLRRVLALGAMGLGVFWVFITLRHLWQGADGVHIGAGFSQPELYSYTLALLITGAVLFYQSLARGSAGLRRAGLVVIGLAVAKVFLLDISGLEGLTRVLSLMVLGLSLAGLAWLNRWAQAKAAPA